MWSAVRVDEVFRLHAEGSTTSAISRATGVSRSQVREWLDTGREAMTVRLDRRMHAAGAPCPIVDDLDPAAYSYLLGQYLGDGCISKSRSTWRLRVAACDDYPTIKAEIEHAMQTVLAGQRVGRTSCQGCTEIRADWNHWPCLFPQHGPGKKHERPIVLEGWQTELAIRQRPEDLIRGLIHSDGCRVINRVGGGRYEYVRYFLANHSSDILGIFETALGTLGIESRRNRWNSVSVARKASVEALERIVGPKACVSRVGFEPTLCAV